MKISSFWVLLLTIGVVWIGNYIYADSQKLDHPVFLPHYFDLSLADEQYVPFYYLTNKEDSSFIQVVEVGDIRGYPERFGETNGIETVQQFGRYSLKRVMIRFEEGAVSTVTEPLRFDEMNVYFSEETETVYSIGQLVFRPNQEELRAFTTTSVSAGNHTEARLKAEEALVIHSVNTAFDELLDDSFKIKLSSPRLEEKNPTSVPTTNEEWNQTRGTDRRDVEFPLHLNEGDPIIIKSFADHSLHAVLSIAIELEGMTDAGKSFSVKEGYLQFDPPVTKQAVKQLIEYRAEATTIE